MIAQPPGKVFAFPRDKHLHAQEPGSPVLLLEKTTPGDVGVGTRFREVVRMLPGVRGEIRSTVSRCESAGVGAAHGRSAVAATTFVPPGWR